MGCDIHTYVEYREPGYNGWISFGGRINPGRDYEMFGYIAGARMGIALTPAKGIPSNLGYRANSDWYLIIDDKFANMDGYTSLKNALQWQKQGHKIIEHPDRPGMPWQIEHPDWHTPTWLTLKEYRACLLENPDGREIVDDYWAIEGAMAALVKRDNDVRLVCWFDN